MCSESRSCSGDLLTRLPSTQRLWTLVGEWASANRLVTIELARMKKESSKKLLTVTILFVVHERLFYYHERLIMEFDNSLYDKKVA